MPKATTPPDKAPDSAPPADQAPAAPFTPQLCQGCSLVEDCSKRALVLELHGPIELLSCGQYSPVTPADPAQE